MGQSAVLNFLQIINAPSCRGLRTTPKRHVIPTRSPIEPLVCEPRPLLGQCAESAR
jgi:hypothetical protein